MTAHSRKLTFVGNGGWTGGIEGEGEPHRLALALLTTGCPTPRIVLCPNINNPDAFAPVLEESVLE